MKRGAIDHPKMLVLASKLGLKKWQAVGIMESVWHFTARYAPQGDIGKYTDEMIAVGIGWTDDPKQLIEALCDSQFLDKSGKVRLYVHDWHDHSDDYADKYLAIHNLNYANDRSPRRKAPQKPKRSRKGQNIPDNSRESYSYSESESYSHSQRAGDAVHLFLVEHETLRNMTYEQDLAARREAGVSIDDPDLMEIAKVAANRAQMLPQLDAPGAFWCKRIIEWKKNRPAPGPLGGENAV